MSINLNMNQGQDVSEGQSASQPPSSDNISIPLQAPFIPTIPMQYPQAGLFAQWLSTPSGSTPSQNPPYYQFNSQPTSSQIPPHYQQNPHPTPLQNLPHYQQNSQPTPLQNPLYHQPQPPYVLHSQQNANPHHQPPPPRPAPAGGSKNWTSEEDLQLCRAWVRVTEDAAIGVGQKKDKLWDRVKDMFQQLMNEVHGKESVRNFSACENRMRDLKGFCSKWAGIRTKAFQQPASGLSLFDSESTEDENNGKPFKHMACWNVLKACPRWYDPMRKPSDKGTGSTSQPCVGAPPEPVDTPIPGFSPVPPASNVARSETPIIPGTQEGSTGSISDVTERGTTSIPILNGPASRDIPHPPGQKITKGAHGRKKQRLSDAQEAASLTLRAGLVSLQASTNARWEKSREDQLVRDKINNQVLQVELRMQAKQHDLDLAKSRANIIDKITASGEMLLLAVQKLDEFGTESVLTPTQKLQYEVRQRAVALRKKQYAELNESLKRTEFQSPTCMEPMFDNPRAGTSQRHLDLEDDEANLGDD